MTCKRNYMEVTVFVSDDSGEKNICVQNETLDGERGMVKLYIRSNKKNEQDVNVGYFNATDLMAAINTAVNANISYLVEQMAEDKHPRGENREYEMHEGKSEF